MTLALLLIACASGPASPNAANDAAAPAAAPATPTTAEAPPTEAPAAPSGNGPFGAPVDVAQAIPVDTVLAEPEAWSGKEVVVKAEIREVCQKKGCWHTLATSQPDVNVLVKDKEYAIFLPKDVAGRTAAVKGTFLVETMSVDEARHYAEDAGKDPSAIVAPTKTFQIDVAGVVLL